MRIPTDHTQGYEKARAVSPDLADKYIEHTLIGDPLAEEMAADLNEFDAADQGRLIERL